MFEKTNTEQCLPSSGTLRYCMPLLSFHKIHYTNIFQQTKQFKQTLCRSLVKFINESQDDWDQKLESIMFGYRAAKYQTTVCVQNTNLGRLNHRRIPISPEFWGSQGPISLVICPPPPFPHRPGIWGPGSTNWGAPFHADTGH